MKSYKVEITETLRRTVTVEARDYDEAIDKVRNLPIKGGCKYRKENTKEGKIIPQHHPA